MRKIVGLLLWLLAAGALAQNVPISGLPAATTSATGVEFFPVVQSATTKKMTLAQVQAFMEGQTNIWTAATTFTQTLTGTNGVFNGAVEALGGVTPSACPSIVQIYSNSTFAGMFMSDCSQPVDQRVWFTDLAMASYGIFATNDIDTVGRAAFVATRTGVAISAVSLGNLTDLPAIHLNASAITVPPAATVPWNKTAYGSVNGLSGCVIDSQVGNSNIAFCTHNSPGNITIQFTTGIFTAAPACTVAAGSGSGGGSNADSLQSVTTALSGPSYVATIISFNHSLTAQDNHFMITCMGN